MSAEESYEAWAERTGAPREPPRPVYEPEPPLIAPRRVTEEEVYGEDGERSSWSPVDLTDALAGVDTPGPELLARTDSRCLLYRGRTHTFQGEAETLKSWAAIVAAAQTMTAGEDVLWIDFEDDERGVVNRLRALGVPVAMIAERFVYLRPDEPLYDRGGRITRGGVDFVQVLGERSYALAVIDGVTEAMTTEGLDLLSNADVAVWARLLPRRLAGTGAAVLSLDHLSKNRDAGNRHAIGAQHKLAGITGAAYRFDLVRPLARAVGAEPVVGSATITVTKDRPGHVRALDRDGKVAVLELTAYPDGSVTASLEAVGGEAAPDLALVRRIAGYLAIYDGASKNNITENVSGKAERIREALAWMVAPGRDWISVVPVGQTHRHYLTEAGRELLDEP
jgi:AAA domain